MWPTNIIYGIFVFWIGIAPDILKTTGYIYFACWTVGIGLSVSAWVKENPYLKYWNLLFVVYYWDKIVWTATKYCF